MLIIRPLIFVALAMVVSGASISFAPPSAQAGNYNRTGVWVYIYKSPNEDVWEACRHVYGRDVYQVRTAGPTRARCFVDASEVNNPQGSIKSRDAY
jgi:hypothetical protein